MPILDELPYVIVRELNEHVRFDKPGRYRLYVVSNRVELGRVPVASNVIQFTSVPADPEWARDQLRAAEAVLNRREKRREEEIQSAARVIRFLGTEDAARSMVRHLDQGQSNLGLGLRGLPFQATAVEAMEAGLEEPDVAVSTSYLRMLLMCSYMEKYGPWYTPSFPLHTTR